MTINGYSSYIWTAYLRALSSVGIPDTGCTCGCLHGVGEDSKQRQALLAEPDEGYFLGCACSLTSVAKMIELEPYPPEASTAAVGASSQPEPRQGVGGASACGTTGSAQAALGSRDSNSAVQRPAVIGVRPLGCVQVRSKAR